MVLLFIYENQEASGGAHDFKQSYPSLQAAKDDAPKKCRRHGDACAHIAVLKDDKLVVVSNMTVSGAWEDTDAAAALTERRFVQVHPERPSEGANSGGVGANDKPEKFWRDNLCPRNDQDVLDFLTRAQVGEHFMSSRGMFFFRTK